MTPFARDGAMICVRLRGVESELLRQLAQQLTVLLGDRASADSAHLDSSSTPDPAAALLAQLGIGRSTTAPLDPALARLLPDAYRDDDTASSEHRRLTELGLIDRKIANANVVVATLGVEPVELDQTAAQSWLRTLTDLRLTLAARLHIEVDGDGGTGDEAMLDVYDWLGYLQGMLLETIEQQAVNGEL